MQKTILTIVLAALCLNFSSNAKAQFYKPSDKTVRMGETLPDSFYQTIHQVINAKTGKATTIQLKDYKNKLIILDFWATWCGPCIHSLNKLDSIIAPMDKKDFVVIPVTYQSIKEIKPALDKFKWNLIFIVDDKTLAQVFPHSGIPHQIWIKDGKVLAIPKWDYATAENITKAIKGEKIEMIMNLKDGVIDPSRPLFVKGNGYTGKGAYFENAYSVIARRLPGFQQQGVNNIRVGDTSIVYSYNLPLGHLFFGAFEKEIFKEFTFNEGSGIYWEISDKLRKRLFDGPKPSFEGNLEQDLLHQAWLDKNYYGYNLRYPKPISEIQALKMMQQDLNIFFGVYLNLEAKIQMRPKQVLVLSLLKDKNAVSKLLSKHRGKLYIDKSGNRKFYEWRNASFRSIHSMLYKLNPDVLLVDSTGIGSAKVSIKLRREISSDLNIAKQELARHGLKLTLTQKLYPVLVIKEGTAK